MGSFDALLERARDAARRIEGVIQRDQNIIIVGHLDADGIACSSLIGLAILRRKGRLITRISGEMDREVLRSLKEEEYDFHILCELGGGLVKEIEEGLGNQWLLVDHHPVPELELKHDSVFNAWRFGYDGSRMVSAAGMAYYIALQMDARNVDLSWLPIIAALGDRQDQGESRSLTSLNKNILGDAVNSGLVQVDKDLMLYGRETKPIHEALASTTTPYIAGLSGSKDACLAMVSSSGIEMKHGYHWRTVAELTADEKRKLIEAIILHFAPPITLEKGMDDLIGEVYTLEKEDEYSTLRDSREFATLLNACGRMGRGEIGVSLCLGDRGPALDAGERILLDYRQTLNRYINRILLDGSRVVDEEKFSLIIGDGLVDEYMLGALSSILSNVPRFTGKVIIAKTRAKMGNLKFSARVASGLEAPVNLGSLMHEAALQCDGVGGGHDAAAGAKIMEVKLHEFLQTVRKGLVHSGEGKG